MGCSKEWDECYKRNEHLSIWPWSDLISYVKRYVNFTADKFKVLELGCGAGANIPFFKSLGMQYYSIEGSKTIVETLWKKFPEYKDTIITGDFTSDIPFEEKFDLIVDRGSLTNNTTLAIKNCLKNIYEKLNKSCGFIGIDWISTLHSDYKEGIVDGDINTKNFIKTGHLSGYGRVHFSDKKHLLELFSNFKMEILEHKIIERSIPDEKYIMASWNFLAIKI